MHVIIKKKDDVLKQSRAFLLIMYTMAHVIYLFSLNKVVKSCQIYTEMFGIIYFGPINPGHARLYLITQGLF